MALRFLPANLECGMLGQKICKTKSAKPRLVCLFVWVFLTYFVVVGFATDIRCRHMPGLLSAFASTIFKVDICRPRSLFKLFYLPGQHLI